MKDKWYLKLSTYLWQAVVMLFGIICIIISFTMPKDSDRIAITIMIAPYLPSHVFFHRVKNAEWSLVTVVPDKIIYRNGRLLGLILLGVTLLGLAAIYFISRRTIKRTR